MKKISINISGFTLIELIVSITIFSMIITAVVSIFLFSSGMSKRVELNRAMQENIKNVVEDMAESVRVSGIEGVVTITQADTSCTASSSGASVVGFKACMKSGEEYVLGYYDDILGNWVIASDFSDCEIPSLSFPDKKNCRILKRYSSLDDYFPLTNSFVAFEEVQFITTNSKIPKMTLVFRIRPSFDKGLSREIIELNTNIIQTTISERLIKTQ